MRPRYHPLTAPNARSPVLNHDNPSLAALAPLASQWREASAQWSRFWTQPLTGGALGGSPTDAAHARDQAADAPAAAAI
ncbi:MAG: hypothetical protein ACHP91_11075, partial [Burkholderiales bacterium]